MPTPPAKWAEIAGILGKGLHTAAIHQFKLSSTLPPPPAHLHLLHLEKETTPIVQELGKQETNGNWLSL